MAWGRLTAAISGFVSSGAAQSRRVGGFGLSTSNERIVSVPLAWSPIYNEEDIAGISVLPMVPLCQFCGAHRLPCEAPFFCCACGKIRLASPITPIVLLELFKDPSSSLAILFRRKVRLYNIVFSFTSFGVRLYKELVSLQRGVYTFRASGQIFHSLPPLIRNSYGPRYFQLYFWDNDNELENKMSVFPDADVDRELMVLLMDIMKVNRYAQLLKRINQYSSIKNLRLHISKNVHVDQRCYNSPSADQVAAIWVESNDDANIPHDMDSCSWS
ncbi:uncharacterized protein [Primulina huaijiensis]|uniref:uncharacterized protein isoform X1 n=1 Tax=Primulina huaijiensis TaxID=1492673 RepID=UPI003CC72F3E